MGSERIVKEILTEKGVGASPDKIRGRENRSGASQAKNSMCEDPEGEGT